MLTATDTLVKPIGATAKSKSVKVLYSPEVDGDGRVYYRQITEAELVDDLVKEDKKGYKIYSVEEVRQKLRGELGLKV